MTFIGSTGLDQIGDRLGQMPHEVVNHNMR